MYYISLYKIYKVPVCPSVQNNLTIFIIFVCILYNTYIENLNKAEYGHKGVMYYLIPYTQTNNLTLLDLIICHIEHF